MTVRHYLHAATFAAAAGTCHSASASEQLTVAVTNTGALARPAETIVIAWASVNQYLPGALLQQIAVKDAAGKLLAYQVTNVAPQAKDPRGVGAAVCKSVKFGVVIYNRNVCKLNAASLLKLADRCPNLIGFKDGVGEIDTMVTIRRKLGDRFTYLGGLPTAEVYAEAYKALGVPVYSSAVFNFIPKTAIAFYEAVRTNDTATTGRLIDSFFLPYLDIRNKQAGYAVSIVKATAPARCVRR